MVHVDACPVCACANLDPYTASVPSPDHLHHAQARCRGCGLLISQPQATREDMERYYRDTYYRMHWPDPDTLTRDNALCYQRHELPVLKALWRDWPPPRGGRVIEVGCGYGAMLPLLERDGFEAMGCDPSADAVAFCRSRHLDVVQGACPGAPLPGPFDVTLCQHVIEHVPEPRAFVESLAALTRAGGIVAVVTEDAWNSQWAWDRVRARVRRRPPPFHTSRDHTYVFRASHLTRLLTEAGCDAVRTWSFSYRPARESAHWRLYKGTFRMLDRALGHGDFLMAVGRVAP